METFEIDGRRYRDVTDVMLKSTVDALLDKDIREAVGVMIVEEQARECRQRARKRGEAKKTTNKITRSGFELPTWVTVEDFDADYARCMEHNLLEAAKLHDKPDMSREAAKTLRDEKRRNVGHLTPASFRSVHVNTKTRGNKK